MDIHALTGTKLADCLAYSKQTVSSEWKDAPRNEDGSYDLPKVSLWLRNLPATQYETARARRMEILADKEEVNLSAKRGKYYLAEDVDRTLAAYINDARRQLQCLADKVSQYVPLESKDIVKESTNNVVENVLNTLAQTKVALKPETSAKESGDESRERSGIK